MFYQPELNNHGLAYGPFKALVVPRPIAWISTIDGKGRVNLSPFSQYNLFGSDPPRVMFTVGKQVTGLKKDTLCNVEEQGEFVVNIATYDLREAVAFTSSITDPGTDELAAAGLTPLKSRLVRPPGVKESPVQLECRYEQTISLPCDTPGNTQSMVIGRVIGIHIDDAFITPDGRVDILKIRPLSRMGYMDYTSVTELFQVQKPDEETERYMSTGRIPTKVS